MKQRYELDVPFSFENFPNDVLTVPKGSFDLFRNDSRVSVPHVVPALSSIFANVRFDDSEVTNRNKRNQFIVTDHDGDERIVVVKGLSSSTSTVNFNPSFTRGGGRHKRKNDEKELISTVDGFLVADFRLFPEVSLYQIHADNFLEVDEKDLIVTTSELDQYFEQREKVKRGKMNMTDVKFNGKTYISE